MPVLQVPMDRWQLALEALAALEQPAIVVEAVEADLAPRRPKPLEQCRIDRIVLGHEEPGGNHAMTRLDLQQRLDALEAARALDVMGQHVSELVTAGPERRWRDAAASR